MTLRQEIETLAALSGVQTSFHDIGGRSCVASTEALLAVLSSLGPAVETERDVVAALDARRAARARRALPDVAVSWGGRGTSIHVPSSALSRRLEIEVTLEDGSRVELQPDVDPERVHRAVDESGAERLRLDVAFPAFLPLGYHRIAVRGPSLSAEGRLWSAPRRAWDGGPERGWGVFAPVYALRSERNDGIGDFEDLAGLARWVGAHGGSAVATLPLLPTFIDGPYDPSPYAPVSRRFFNELYLSLDHLGDEPELADARALRDSAGYRATTAQLGAAPHVDYRGALTHKRRVLSLAAERYFAAADRLDALGREHPDWVDYARFRAAAERQSRPMAQWPQALRAGVIVDADLEPTAFRYHLYCQLLAHRQLEAVAREARDLGVGFYMDLPLGAHPGGYDAWKHPDELMGGCSVGAPPDTLFEGGQDWGFAPPHPERGSARGHQLFIECLRHHLQHAAALRIDHVMGLERLYCIPRGFPATAGVYVKQPAEELYAAICIESHRAATRVIGEDLGTVLPETRRAMGEHGLGRLFVLQYEPVPDREGRHEVAVDATASLNTHDMPTFAGFWQGGDIDTRVGLGLLDEGGAAAERRDRAELRSRLEGWLESLGYLEHPSSDEGLLGAELRYLAASPARMLLVSLGDLTADEIPQNVPGTGPDRHNWMKKAKLPVESLPAAPGVERLLSALQRTGDAPAPAPAEPPPIRSRRVERVLPLDRHLLAEGTHREIYRVLGAHPFDVDGQSGVAFAVWAPNAASVAVMGDFNGWRGDDAPLWPSGAGVWEGFVPGLREGDLYKYVVTTHDGARLEKADPVAQLAETPPRTASVVRAPTYEFGDAAWMQERASRNGLEAPCSIYEVHLGSWRRAGDGALMTYREIAPLLADHVRDLGFTHVELMPVMEHPFYGSWGYQLTGYFAPTSRYGSPEDLMFLVDTLHQAGIGVIFDWVPGHFPTDAHGLGVFDGTHLYEHADPRRGFHPDWKSYIFNYGRHEVRSFLVSSAHYWLDRFHGDGLRVDGVASMLYLDYSRSEGEWLPNVHGGRENLEAMGFLRALNESIYERFPDVQTAAEESTSWPLVSRPTYVGGLGFGLKWDMGWMHDALEYFRKEPVHRRYHHDMLTFRSLYAYHENFVLPLSHDEVVHGKGSLLAKMPGDDWQKFANLRLLYAFMYASPGHKLLFMGSELAPWTEWNHDEPLPFHLLDQPMHGGVAETLRQLNRLYRSEGALHELDRSPDGLEWVDTQNGEMSVLAFERRGRAGGSVLCAFNFTPVPRHGYRLGVSREGYWREVLNTDAAELGGSGVGNFGGVEASRAAAHGRATSIEVTLPPLAAVWFRAPG